MELIFWLSLVLLAFGFAGYPVLMILWARRRRQTPVSPAVQGKYPSVSFILIVADEADRVLRRIHNLLSTSYPSDLLEVVVLSDGSRDETVPRLQELIRAEPRVRLLTLAERQGKANGLNQAVAAAQGEVLVFADARQEFAPDTVELLVTAVMQEGVGAVSGRLVVQGEASAVGQGVSSYWTLETRLRAAESVVDSCIGCTGAIYAIRRKFYQPIPVDTLLDDVVVPMQISLQGQRVIYLPDAIANDPQDLSPERERIRKRRTLAGNFQMLFRYPAWLWPGRNRLWFQLWAHKYLRLAGPVLLLLVLCSSFFLRDRPFYQICLWGQVGLYLLALIGLAVPKLPGRIWALPAGFVFLNWMIVCGFLHYISSPSTGAWEKVKKTST